MAVNTVNLGLIKPDLSEAVDITPINANMDTLDAAIIAKQDKESGKGLSTNDYTNEDKAAVEDWRSGYIYRTSAQEKTLELDASSSYFVVLTYGSGANFYFLNTTASQAYNKTLIEQIDGVSRSIDGRTVTFSSETVSGFTLFARKLN